MTRNCSNRTWNWLTGIGLLIFAGKPTENVTVKYLTKHVPYVFYKFHISDFLSVLKKTNLLHICVAAYRL